MRSYLMSSWSKESHSQDLQVSALETAVGRWSFFNQISLSLDVIKYMNVDRELAKPVVMETQNDQSKWNPYF